jgi:hypothetical protein
MKTKSLLLMIYLLCSSIIYAQSGTINKLFDKYENEDNITVISISKAMFNIIPKNINTGNVNLKNIIHKIESMRIITSNNADLKEKMNSEFKLSVNGNKDYEELMRVKDGKSNIIFNVKRKENLINELILLINDENDFVAIYITGNFTLNNIQDIIKETNIQ